VGQDRNTRRDDRPVTAVLYLSSRALSNFVRAFDLRHADDCSAASQLVEMTPQGCGG
jgi:hypothetical protein